jgi:putative pyruvate formate lyase activating enzyme
MRFLAREISPRTYVNLMAQYRPCGRAGEYPPLNRRPTAEEFEQAERMAEEEGVHRLDRRTELRLFDFP